MRPAIRYAKTPPDRVSYLRLPNSPAGPLLMGFTNEGALCRVHFLAYQTMESTLNQWKKEWPQTLFIKAKNAGPSLDAPGPPLHMVGTDFQCKVWTALLSIPSGKTASYGEIARRIGSPRAARAVGGACGANPIPYFVPCHRVVAGNGGLGGFSSAPQIKKNLLAFEGVLPQP